MKRVGKCLEVIDSESRKMSPRELKALSKKLSDVHGRVLLKILLLKKTGITFLVFEEWVLTFPL